MPVQNHPRDGRPDGPGGVPMSAAVFGILLGGFAGAVAGATAGYLAGLSRGRDAEDRAAAAAAEVDALRHNSPGRRGRCGRSPGRRSGCW